MLWIKFSECFDTLNVSNSLRRWFWCRLHQQFLAGTVQTGPASFAHHQRRALHGRRHQDGRGQKLPTAAAVVFHLVVLHALDFSAHSHLSSYQSSQAIGAKSIDLEWVQVHPTGLVKPDDADAKIKFLAAEVPNITAMLQG